MSDSVRQVIALRRRFRAVVAANLVTVAHRWGQPCHAFNVHVEPSHGARDGLAAVQDALAATEPNLLRCPRSSLHVSVAWLLAVHVDYAESKAAIWERRGGQWVGELAAIAREHDPFELRYRWLVATDTAVIAIAEPVGPIGHLREQIRARLALPEQTRNTAQIVHTTLFRYRSPLVDPVCLLTAVETVELDTPMTVHELTVSEELVFPSLVSAERARLPLGQERT
ncbi:MAG TPA: hypothetical protein VE441_02795 [Mycobacterium sp.]|nr:hypothetical protein [Mycobacterium sp.]